MNKNAYSTTDESARRSARMGVQMNNIDRSLQQLIDDVLASDIYHAYKVQCARIKEQPELKKQVDEYRARNLELQTNETTTFEQIDRFEREYAGFRDIPMVEDFLAAELAFCRLLQNINLRLTEAMNFE